MFLEKVCLLMQVNMPFLYTIIIHTGALVFTIKSYTGAKLPDGLTVSMVFNVGYGTAVAWNILCDGIFY